jgi:hypothetical protein
MAKTTRPGAANRSAPAAPALSELTEVTQRLSFATRTLSLRPFERDRNVARV